MTPQNYSQDSLKVTRLMLFPTTRITIVINIWNFRTILETRRTSQSVTRTKRYNFMILEISEHHWSQARQKKLDSGQTLLYFDQKSSHNQEIALKLYKETWIALREWESHVSKIVKASFKRKKKVIMMDVIQCVESKNDSIEETGDQLYKKLQSIIEKHSR